MSSRPSTTILSTTWASSRLSFSSGFSSEADVGDDLEERRAGLGVLSLAAVGDQPARNSWLVERRRELTNRLFELLG
jgi:hypothetical protein